MSEQDSNAATAAGDHLRYRAAAGTAAVAAAFCVAVGLLVLVRKIQDRRWHPLDSPRALALADARDRLLEEPDNVNLRQRVRQADQTIITRHLRNQELYDRGVYLLLSGGAVFVAAAGLASVYRRKLPRPGARDVVGWDARLARWGRSAVAALVGIVAAGGVYVAATAKDVDYEAIAAAPHAPAKPMPGPLAKAPSQPAAKPPASAGPREDGWPRVARFPSPREIAENWPRFRGPGGLGAAPAATPPLDFDTKSGKNIAWKTPVPLPGQSSPVVWGRRVFLSGADHQDKKRQVYCFDADSGKLLWAQDVSEGPRRTKKPEHVMEDTGFAAPTMVADAQRVYAIFAMGEIACFDHDGSKVWGRYLGPLDTDYGHAASLAMHVAAPTKARILAQLDQGAEEDQKSRLVVLDAATGEIDGQVKRPVGSSWTSPIVVRTPRGEQIVTCANPWVIAYSAADGKELWRVDCLEGDGAPSPIFAAGVVVAGNVSSRICAIRPDGRGNVTKTHVAWSCEDDVPDVCSPVSDGKYVYMLTSDGLLTCLRLADGKKVYDHDLEAPFTASLTLAGDRLYLLGTKGLMVVGKAGEKFKELGRSLLAEKCTATPAFCGDSIWIRSQKHLYCIRQKN